MFNNSNLQSYDDHKYATMTSINIISDIGHYYFIVNDLNHFLIQSLIVHIFYF